MRIVCYELAEDGLASSPRRFAIQSEKDLVGELRQPRCLAYVLSSADAPALALLSPLVMDRGDKHDARPLAKILLGHTDCFPLVNTPYAHIGQLLRGIRSLLRNAERNGEVNQYLIGVEPGLFESLWAENRAASEDDAEPLEAVSDESGAGELPLLMAGREEPEELLRAYVGTAPCVRLVRQLVLRAAPLEFPVLVLGDSGTGKEVVARAIHRLGPRHNGAFVAVNCGALPEDLFESELFGHVAGAFTGAQSKRDGLWRFASGGTLFLDEIGDLSLSNQVKILRALEEKAIRPVGANRSIAVDTRIVAATHRDLSEMVENGQFREDLYYRLRSFIIRTPALREHPEDLPPLAQRFWNRIAPQTTLPEEVVASLPGHGWPGNARELKTVLECLFAFFGAHGLTRRHIAAVFNHLGQKPSDKHDNYSLDFAEYRIDCLEHLQKALGLLTSIDSCLSELSGDAARRADEEMKCSFLGWVDELAWLGASPLLFHNEMVYNGFRVFSNQIEHAGDAEADMSDPDLQVALRSAIDLIKDEADQLEYALQMNEEGACSYNHRQHRNGDMP